MKTQRRDFLRAGVAAALYGAAGHGWTQEPEDDARADASTVSGWGLVPGILAKIVPPQFQDMDFLITNYGASSGHGTDCAPAIKAAIQACHNSGGGRVIVPAGNWLSNGPVHLLSDVNLYLEDGAVLTFGTTPKDYLPVQLVRWQGIRCYNYSPLIYAYKQENIAVTGSGRINCQGTPVWSKWKKLQKTDWALLQKQAEDGVPLKDRVYGAGHYLRPSALDLYECKNILIQGITIADSPFWTIHPTFCTNVTVLEVTVTQGAPNDDGCDPDSCKDVWIAGCSFSTVDDNISIKAGENPDAVGLPGCENIVVQNCDCVYSDWSSLTLGTNVGSTIRNVFMEGCTVGRTRNAHFIKAHQNWGGGVQNVYFRNNKIGTCDSVISLEPDVDSEAGTMGPPAFANINLHNVTCDQVVDVAFFLIGDPRLPIDGVALSNIAIKNVSRISAIKNVSGFSATGITANGKPVTVIP